MLHLFLVLSLAASDVLDVGPTQVYPDVQSAVHAAQSGDVIRVEDGIYPYFGVFNKSLRIVARHDNGNVRIDGTVRIQEIAAGQEVLIDGLEIVAADQSTQPAVVIANTGGAIRIQDCEIRGSTGFNSFSTQGRQALRAINVDDLTVHRSTLTGGEDRSGHVVGQDAVVLTSVTATFWDSTIAGTDCAWPAFGSRGGEGVFAQNSDLFFQGCTIRSGNGGDSDFIACGANGCPGTCILSVSTVLRVRDNEYDPGRAGWGCGSGGCSTFAFGETIEDGGSGLTTEYPGVGAQLELGHALQTSGDALTLEVDGPVGSAALLVIGPATGRLVPTFPGYVGDVHVSGPLGAPRRVFIGSAPAVLSTTLPDFGSLGITQWYVQPALIGNGEILMGPVRGITILGSDW